LEPCWMIIDDIFISRIPYAYSNPFICSLWQNEKCPSFREEGFSFWSYFLTLLIMAPGTSLLNGIVISFATGEWKSGRLFRREMCITTIVLSFTALFQAFNHKGLLEGKWGHIYHNEAGLPSIPSILYEVVLFNIIADAWFYWSHRLFHEVEWLYRNSHYLHHSAHPVNTFIGNGGDVLELVSQSEANLHTNSTQLAIRNLTYFHFLVCPRL